MKVELKGDLAEAHKNLFREDSNPHRTEESDRGA